MHRFDSLNIAVAGSGYVGLSLATLLSQLLQVTAVDIIPEKVEKINKRISPIQDEYIEKYFAEKELDLTATLDGEKAYADADFVIIAAPTPESLCRSIMSLIVVLSVVVLRQSSKQASCACQKNSSRAALSTGPPPSIIAMNSSSEMILTPSFSAFFSFAGPILSPATR